MLPRLLEAKSQSEAPLPRLVRPVRRRDDPEVRSGNVRRWISEVCMIRRVERLGAELQVSALRDPERAEDTQVSLEEARTTQSIPPDRSKARASLRHPGTIRRAVYPKHRV